MTLAASLLTFLLLNSNVQEKASKCLKYEAQGVVLSGVIERKTFPGPPNYESIAAGDRPEVMWVLKLAAPICLDQNEMNDAEASIDAVQLVFNQPADYQRYKLLLRRQVTVTGELFHAFTGHHHTPVLIQVSEIKKKTATPVASTKKYSKS